MFIVHALYQFILGLFTLCPPASNLNPRVLVRNYLNLQLVQTSIVALLPESAYSSTLPLFLHPCRNFTASTGLNLNPNSFLYKSSAIISCLPNLEMGKAQQLELSGRGLAGIQGKDYDRCRSVHSRPFKQTITRVSSWAQPKDTAKRLEESLI